MWIVDRDLDAHVRAFVVAPPPSLQPVLHRLRAQSSALLHSPRPAVTDRAPAKHAPTSDPHDYGLNPSLSAGAVVTNPSSTILLGDTAPCTYPPHTLNAIYNGDADWIYHAPYDFITQYQWDPPNERHNGMANFGFCDGHAKAMRADQTYSTTTSMWTVANTYP